MRARAAAFLVASILISAALPPAVPAQSISASISDEDISDAYIYLLGRLLVTRQQQLDFREGSKWNELMHRRPGAVLRQ
jgi:hypothetical protein